MDQFKFYFTTGEYENIFDNYMQRFKSSTGEIYDETDLSD